MLLATTTPTGHRVGPYEVIATLGKGGMGEVYRAKDSKLKRVVALKVLPADADLWLRASRAPEQAKGRPVDKLPPW